MFGVIFGVAMAGVMVVTILRDAVSGDDSDTPKKPYPHKGNDDSIRTRDIDLEHYHKSKRK